MHSTLETALKLLGLFGAVWGKVWALHMGAKVWDLIRKVQDP